jgi:hypothetical protein
MNTRDHGCRPLKGFASTRDYILALLDTGSNAHSLLLLPFSPFFSTLAYTGICTKLYQSHRNNVTAIIRAICAPHELVPTCRYISLWLLGCHGFKCPSALDGVLVYTNSNGHCLLDNSTRHQTRNMSMSAVGQVIGASIFMASQRTEPYEPSISSSASSSQTPIVSDAASTQRSVASSISYNSRSNQGDA